MEVCGLTIVKPLFIHPSDGAYSNKVYQLFGHIVSCDGKQDNAITQQSIISGPHCCKRLEEISGTILQHMDRRDEV